MFIFTLLDSSSGFRSSESACRCSVEDLERERGPVLEEWRGQRTAGGRAMEALWKAMHEGSIVADRMPIGLESVIQGVSADTVRAFYHTWYHPHNLAVIVFGYYAVPPPDPPPRSVLSPHVRMRISAV